MRSVIIVGVAIILCILMLTAGTHAKEDRECIRYAPPTATPIPPKRVYSEWIPMPGTSPRTGHGWIDAREIKNYERTHRVLSDAEYAATSRKKRADTKKGKQHSKQPKKIAKKTARHRK